MYLDKDIWGIIAVILTVIAFIPYIVSIIRGATKPHIFTWFIWLLCTAIVFFAQIYDDGGAGAWSTGVSAALTGIVAVLAYIKKVDIDITRSDWLLFIIALSAIPLWYYTSSPLWSVVILTIIDTIAFIPTIRKSWYKPFQEQILFLAIIIFRNITSIVALENYSIITVLFPAIMSFSLLTLVAVIFFRRRVLS